MIKSARLISPLLGILVVVAVLSGCPYVPPEVLDPPAGDFSRAMSTFAKSAREEHLASYRHEGRRDLFIKVALTTLETNWTDASLVEALSGQAPKNFLCLPNYGYERIATRLGYVEGVGSALGDRLKTPGDDIPTLFASLSTNYAIKADPKVIPETIDMWYATPAGKRCEDAANGSSADPFAYRTMGREAVPLVAGIALIDTVWTIIKPVVIGTLKSADIERRNAAVQAYFANDENVKQLGSQLSMIESWLKEQSIIEQKRAGGRAIVTSVLLFDSDAPHWQKIRQIAGTPECRENLQRLGSETTNGRGVACFDAVLAAAAAPLDNALQAADKLDVSLVSQLPHDLKPLSQQVTTLQQIALGKLKDEELAKDLWKTLLRYTALFQTANEAASTANKKKITDAISALQASLGTK